MVTRRSRVNSVRGFWRRRHEQRLIGEAAAWIEHLTDAATPDGEGFGAWLLRSPDHVRVVLELSAFREELAQQLGYPAFGAHLAAVGATEPAPVSDSAPNER